MSVLQLFITPEELETVIRQFAADHQLRGCSYDNGRFEPLPTPSVQMKDGVVKRLFLVPADQPVPEKSAPRPRELGWIDVMPGRLVQANDSMILTITTLQAEDKDHLSFKPTAWLRALKKRLSSSLSFGVRGVNVVYGGSDNYSTIGYSPKALELYRSGKLWKQDPGDNSVFEPLTLAPSPRLQ
jgi:hypothetical protein